MGERTYSIWLEMLRHLVPQGRTHRLSVLVAGMLQYAAQLSAEQSGERPAEGSVAASLLSAGVPGDPEEAIAGVSDLVKRLFEDAGVAYGRTSRRGEDYSIADEAIAEFVHWYEMPWK